MILQFPRSKAPDNVKLLYKALKSSEWGQFLIDMVICAAAAETPSTTLIPFVPKEEDIKHG